MIYLEMNCAQVIYHAELKAMEIHWLDFANEASYQKVLNAAYEVIEHYQTPHWISDMRLATVVKLENQEWLQEVFIPKVFALNILKKGAYIVSKDMFNQFYLDSVKGDLEKEEHHFQTKYFQDKESALDWLSS